MAACVPGRREGGVANVILNLGRELRRSGHEVDCLFREDLLGNADAGRFEAVTFARKLAEQILREKERYTIVNVHAPVGFAYGFLRHLRRSDHLPPYVMTMHGLEERRVHAMSREHRKGHAWNFTWKNRLWHSVYHQLLYRYCITTADRSIVLNREAWSYLQIKYDLDCDRVWYTPNGVEERFLLKREYPLSVLPRLLFVGTWLDQRGIYYLAHALSVLADKLPSIRLTIAGCSGSDEIKAVFAEPLRPRIKVIPFIEAAEMPSVFAEHDVFVFPSLMEGMPLALLEAMATGMPVVTTETCGMADVVQDGINGLLISPADTNALVEAILQLAESVELRRRLGQAAQQSMQNYTWDKIAQRVEKIFTLAAKNGNC